MRGSIITYAFMCAALVQAAAYGQDPDTASERERLGNERARIEAERRAQDSGTELAAQGDSGPATTAAETVPGANPVEAPAAAPAAAVPLPAEDTGVSGAPSVADDDTVDISQALEQLRELGELKDAGYVTQDEFDRIKRRIMKDRF